MEPKLPTPNSGHEKAPLSDGNALEHGAVEVDSTSTFERGGEQFEQRSESAPQQFTPVVLPVPVVAPLPPPSSTSDSDVAVTGDNPIVAADDDLIEREWVDRAKKIIQQTKDDPYRREQEISRLQVDYLRKRYGKERGASQ